MTSSTSINGMKLISGSSRGWLPRRFTVAFASVTLAVRQLDQLDPLLLQLDDEVVDLGAEMAIEDHARDGDDESQRGVVECYRNPVREQNRIRPGGGLRSEDLDHADDGTEKAEQGRHRRNGAERGQQTREVVADDAPALFDRLLHARPWALDVGQSRRQHAAQRPLTRGPRQQFL